MRVLQEAWPRVPAARFFRALRNRDIRVNGRRVRDDGPVQPGDRIEVYLPDSDFLAQEGADGSGLPDDDRPDYLVVHTDGHLLVVSKAQGLSIHSGEDEEGSNLVDRIREDFGDRDIRLCHRLDRNTGGLVMLGRDDRTLRTVAQAMRDGAILKRYRCLVSGVPDMGVPVRCADGTAMKEIRDSWEKPAGGRIRQVHIHAGEEAGDRPVATRYRVLAVHRGVGPEGSDASELEVELVTGKTHQIRAHFAFHGHPVLGDGRYGKNTINRHYRLRRQQLWSVSLDFRKIPKESGHPLSNVAGRLFRIEPEYDDPRFRSGKAGGRSPSPGGRSREGSPSSRRGQRRKDQR